SPSSCSLPCQDNPEHDGKAERCLPVHRAGPMSQEVPEQRDNRRHTQAHRKHGCELDEQLLGVHFTASPPLNGGNPAQRGYPLFGFRTASLRWAGHVASPTTKPCHHPTPYGLPINSDAPRRWVIPRALAPYSSPVARPLPTIPPAHRRIRLRRPACH